MENLLHYRSLVIIGWIFLFIYRSIDFQVYILVTNEILFVYFLLIFFGRMLFLLEAQYVRWSLTVIVHLQFIRFCHIRFGLELLFKVNSVFVGDCRVSIQGSLGIWTNLFISEDVVEPFWNTLAHIVALKGFSNSCHESVWISLTPMGQLNVINFLFVRSSTKVDVVFVKEHFGKVKEFRSDFSHIWMVVQSITEGIMQRMEDTIRIVVVHTLELNYSIDVGTQPS